MRNRWDRGGRPHPPDGMGWGCSRRRRGKKAKKKRKHLPAGLGPGPQGSPTHHERSVGILIHCRSTGERERKSFFLSLSVRPCPSIPAGVTVEAEGAADGPASVPRTNVDTGARAPPPQFIGRFGAAPTVSCNRSVILDRSTIRTLIHRKDRRFIAPRRNPVLRRGRRQILARMVFRERPGPR